MKEETETISKKEIEKVINTINEAEEKVGIDNKSIDLAKVKEVISSFEGCTPQTIMGVCTTTLFLLPTGAIIAVINMSKKVFAAKASDELKDIIGKECHNCECEERVPEE